jgi:hypothetical protein
MITAHPTTVKKHQTIARMIFDVRGGAETVVLSVSRASRELGAGVRSAGCSVSIVYGADEALRSRSGSAGIGIGWGRLPLENSTDIRGPEVN